MDLWSHNCSTNEQRKKKAEKEKANRPVKTNIVGEQSRLLPRFLWAQFGC